MAEAATLIPVSKEIVSFEQAFEAATHDAEVMDSQNISVEGAAPMLEEGAAPAPKTPSREVDGKFKGKEADPAAKKTEEPAKKKDEVPTEGSIGKARRLFAEGHVEDAIKYALGVDAEDLTLNSKQWTEFRRKVKATKAQTEKAQQEANAQMAEVRQIANRFAPLAQAQLAFQNGDYEAALRLAFGEDLNGFQKKAIAKLQHSDPKVAELQQQLQAERAARQKFETDLVNNAKQRAGDEQIQNYVTNLRDELLESGDARFEKAASKKLFIERVFEIQGEHWSKRTQKTIPTSEAAELAWEELYGDVVDDTPRDRGSKTRETTGRTGKSVSKPKAGTILKQHEAAEAAPEEEMSPDDKLAYWIARAKSEQHA